MPRVCTICTHPDRDAIDAALIRNDTFRHIAARFNVSTGSLQRHRIDHLPASLVAAQAAQEVVQADSLLSQVQSLQGRAQAILDRAEQAGDLTTALKAIRELRGVLELLAKLEGQIATQPTVNILVSPDWQRVRSVLMVALAPHPEARQAVAAALLTVQGQP